jgi:hypothetical protein
VGPQGDGARRKRFRGNAIGQKAAVLIHPLTVPLAGAVG